jgi:hemerythrin-like domain-containing protein
LNDRSARWLEEHSNFARLLDVLEGELEAFHWAAKPNYRLMLDVMSYMTQYPDRFHHPSEELAFAKAVHRNPRLQIPVEALNEEHGLLCKMGESLVERLEAVLNEALLPRAEVEAGGLEYIRCLRRHMRREEVEVFPAVGRLLSAKDWDEIDERIEHRPDPVFGPKVLARFRALRRQIAADAKALG